MYVLCDESDGGFTSGGVVSSDTSAGVTSASSLSSAGFSEKSSSGDLEIGLVGYLNMDLASITDDIHEDNSVNDNDGTLIGSPANNNDGKILQARDFGSGKRIDWPVDGDFSPGSDDDFTASIFFRTSDTGSDFRNMLIKRRVGSPTPFNIFLNNSGNLVIGSFDGSNDVSVVSGSTVNDGNYHHAAMVHKADGSIEGFLDGVSIGTANDSGNPTSNSEDVIVGDDVLLGRTFPGQLDDARLYERALAGGEITKLSNGET